MKYKKLTSRQTIKHVEGTEHIETYCHGHRYGPAAFPHKYGASDPQEYSDYCEMVDRLAEYEDTGLSPEQVKGLQQEVEIQTINAKTYLQEAERLKERLQISPYGDDKIDEQEEAMEFLRFEIEQLKAQNAVMREALSTAKQAILKAQNTTGMNVYYCTQEALAAIDKAGGEKVEL